jgi:glutamate-ammonia-ligase adenylyltransferase
MEQDVRSIATASAGHANWRELLGDPLHEDEIRDLLAPVGFTDWRAASYRLQKLARCPHVREALADCLPHLLATLSQAAHPDRVLINLERFAQQVDSAPALFRYLAENPRAVEILVILFAASQFFTRILLRAPQHFERLMERESLTVRKSAEQFRLEALAAIAPFASFESQLDALRRYQRWELLRIGTADLLELFDLTTATTQLSRLADGLVQVCLSVASVHTKTHTDGFAVLALGKLGGEELNYSSDIDLVFLAASNGVAYQRLGERLIEALERITAEGFLYRVDMRLRPWGRVGALVPTLDGYTAYLRKDARLWEKQALLKARVVAGDRSVGERLLRHAEPLIFASESETVRLDIRAMKQRMETPLRRRGNEWGEVKLGAGSIRDVEFVAQYLQLVHGAEHPELHTPNTLDALDRLAASGFLSADHHRVLRDGYIFLRTVEHFLQIMDYQQTHMLPDRPDELASLARRLGFQGSGARARFVARHRQNRVAIRAVYRYFLEDTLMESPADNRSPLSEGAASSRYIQRHLSRMVQSYVDTFSDEEIEHHAALARRLGKDNLVEVEATPLDDERWRVTVVGYDYLGELSLICGLLFVYGFTILEGHVFTYDPVATLRSTPVRSRFRPARRRHRRRAGSSVGDTRRKIVDVFTVRSVSGEVREGVWPEYAKALAELVSRLHVGQQREAQGELAKRVAGTLREAQTSTTSLYPIDIEIDNDASDRYTILRIDAPDTVGFLYELTNALSLVDIYIARVTVRSVGNRVHDVLYITDARGRKITAPRKQRELRAATVLVKHFTHLLPHSPNPESALLHFRSFVGQLFMHSDWPSEVASLDRPEVLNALARLLGVSDFLWEDFLRMQYANLFSVVRDVDEIAIPKSAAQLRQELEKAFREAADNAARVDALNAFKDREMFRIDMRHILGHIMEFGWFSEELTNLAEVVVDAAYRLCNEQLSAQFGTPLLESGAPCPLSVCALGKFGGYGLGFASDVELMFIYSGNGMTSGPRQITNAEYFERLVQEFLRAIRAKQEGIFEVDLRLRPYGNAGSLAVSLDAFRSYFGPNGAAWPYERQALVKLRPVAGDAQFGAQVAALRDQLIYTGEHFDVTAMRAMRERQLRHLVSSGTINAKYSPGGLVDVEYLVQGLQIMHGHRSPRLRQTNTQAAMAALAEEGILSPEDYSRLRQAHIFLRQLIDALRMVRGNAKDLEIPPADSEEFAYLARRLQYGSDLTELRRDLTYHTTNVRELSLRLLGNES